MSGRIYEGTIVNGKVQLPAGVNLPEGLRVLVTAPNPQQPPRGYVRTPRLAIPQQAQDFQMEVEEMGNASV
ncbi:MAG: hypothetical protein K8T91_11360 [Planctomycetes bacterium]|nr:hypothetical protein [Planctomycetota bacterium]